MCNFAILKITSKMIKRILILVITVISSFMGDIIAQEIIPMKRESSGLYTLPCEINGLHLSFILDTGASAVSISLTEATFMLKNGYLEEDDITGTTNIQTAEGNIEENYIINLKEVKIGSVTLHNIQAVVSSGLDAPLLLGQSVLSQLGHWSVNDNSLVLYDYNEELEFTDVLELINYCKAEYRKGSKSKALQLLQDFQNGDNIDAQIAYVDLIKSPDEDNGHLIKCINSILNYHFQDPEDEFNALWLVARLYDIYYDDEEKCVQLYEQIARNEKYDKSYRYKAFVALYITFMHSNPTKANNYALEALNQGMYELTTWYCNYYLLENNMNREAYQWYNKGYLTGETHSSFGLAKGFVNGIWPIKNIEKGLQILKSLAENQQYADAIYVLCDYYWEKGDFKSLINYAQMLSRHNSDAGRMYEAIGYYNQKDYFMFKNRLEHINPDHISSVYLNCYYYYLFGMMFMDGLGTSPNLSKAYDYFAILAEKDAGWGNACLGDLQLSPFRETIDYKSAYYFFLLGANNNDGYSCYQVALLHKYGLGTYQSDTRARQFLRKAQDLGYDISGFDD